MAALKVVCAVIACMLVVAPLTRATITCNQVAGGLSSCIQYIRGKGPLASSCCTGINNLISAACTTPDCQQATGLQGTAKTIPDIDPKLAAGLPGKYGVNIPYKISTSTNCAQVK